MKTKDLSSYIEEHHLSEADVLKVLEQTRDGNRQAPRFFEERKIPYSDQKVRFTVISDTHMGHKCYRPDILEHAIKTSKRFGSEFWLHAGDIIEGMSGRDGHIYELTHLGATAQLKYGVEQLSLIPKPIFGITANNSHDGWFHCKSNAGLEIGPELEEKVENFKFLGYDEADLVLDNGLKIRLRHPGGGTPYAVSYKGQKYLNAISGGKKPDLCFQGHLHKSMYMFYRNVHFFDAGTLEEQTIFMRQKDTPAMLGYWLVEARKNKLGTTMVEPRFVPFYE